MERNQTWNVTKRFLGKNSRIAVYCSEKSSYQTSCFVERFVFFSQYYIYWLDYSVGSVDCSNDDSRGTKFSKLM